MARCSTAASSSGSAESPGVCMGCGRDRNRHSQQLQWQWQWVRLRVVGERNGKQHSTVPHGRQCEAESRRRDVGSNVDNAVHMTNTLRVDFSCNHENETNARVREWVGGRATLTGRARVRERAGREEVGWTEGGWCRPAAAPVSVSGTTAPTAAIVGVVDCDWGDDLQEEAIESGLSVSHGLAEPHTVVSHLLALPGSTQRLQSLFLSMPPPPCEQCQGNAPHFRPPSRHQPRVRFVPTTSTYRHTASLEANECHLLEHTY